MEKDLEIQLSKNVITALKNIDEVTSDSNSVKSFKP